MTKADVFLIIANVYLAQNLRDKPFSIAVLSVSYFLLFLINLGIATVLK
jgi:hypothetical protein